MLDRKTIIPALRLLVALCAIGIVYGCGEDAKMNNGKTTSSTRTSSDGKKNNAAEGADGADGDDGAADGEGDVGGEDDLGDGAEGGDDAVDVGDGSGDGSDGSEDGELFFTSTVLPMLNVQCVSCHADPRIPVDVRAPLSIYSYDKMHALLAIGKGPQSNGLYGKIRNIAAHSGGDRCSGNPTATPCQEIMDWWQAEFGEASGGGDDTPRGQIADVTALGEVYGYAYDPADTTMAVSVSLYGDGPKGSGTLIGTFLANEAGADGNTPGSHAFIFQLPAAWRDGQAHELHAYIGDSDDAMMTARRAYTAYSFTTAGRNFYQANVRGALNSCQGCHTVTYEQQFYSLIAPSPAQGATATNNQLINKAAQTNGVSHGGGLRCNGVNASPCNVIQQWWNIEFGG